MYSRVCIFSTWYRQQMIRPGRWKLPSNNSMFFWLFCRCKAGNAGNYCPETRVWPHHGRAGWTQRTSKLKIRLSALCQSPLRPAVTLNSRLQPGGPDPSAGQEQVQSHRATGAIRGQSVYIRLWLYLPLCGRGRALMCTLYTHIWTHWSILRVIQVFTPNSNVNFKQLLVVLDRTKPD